MDIPEHTEEPSSVATNDSSSTLEQLDQSSSDLNEESGEKQPSPQSLKTDARAIVRRTCLPSPVVGDQGSLFAVLKKNIGKVSASSLPLSCACSFLRRIYQPSPSLLLSMSPSHYSRQQLKRWNTLTFSMKSPAPQIRLSSSPS